MGVRLNKYIADAGICSRRKADELIGNGNVKVNGATMKELGYQVEDGDVVLVNGKKIETAGKKVYVVVNKPLGYITSMDDDKDRATVAELVSDIPERLFPVGRLDYNTSGLLIMTNDGQLTYTLTHPKHEVYKTYIAKVAGVLSDARIAKLRKGVDIGGFITSPAKVKVIKQMPRHAIVEISIREGKNRQVRKMFAAVGNKVQELQRVSIGEIKLGRLMEGHYRKLNREEIEYLKKL
ncbi:MAG: rRNA pseudouridine synthase [Firmicutes bacterium]|nr:rRNA pseudouridine synthase [Bacillota bacterium]